MVDFPKTYYINKWFSSLSDGTAPIYRTNDLEDFLNHVEKVMKEYNLSYKNSRFMVRGDNTFFSFFVEGGEHAWDNARYFSTPDELYTTLNSYRRSVAGRLKSKCQDSQGRQICMTA